MEDQYKSNSLLQKAKSAFTKAKLSRYLSFLFVLGAVVVYSLWDVGWKPENIGWSKFAGNVSLLIFLGVYGIFFGENEGSNFFRTYIKGLYQACITKFRGAIRKIVDKNYIDALPDYIPWRYQKDYQSACKMKLLSVRVYDETILDLDYSELNELRYNPIKKGDNYYSKLSEEQYQVVSDIKNGKVFVDYFDDYNFYLMEDNQNGEEQAATRVKNTPKRKEKISWQQRLSRIALIFIFALIIAGFYRNIQDPSTITEEVLKEQQQEAIRTLFSRIATLLVSITTGINTARLLNLEDCFVIKYKTSYLEVFFSCLENKSFVLLDYKSKAKEDYDKYLKEEEEERKKVIIAEVVEEPKMLSIDVKEE